jgi:hypothetical protein
MPPHANSTPNVLAMLHTRALTNFASENHDNGVDPCLLAVCSSDGDKEHVCDAFKEHIDSFLKLKSPCPLSRTGMGLVRSADDDDNCGGDDEEEEDQEEEEQEEEEEQGTMVPFAEVYGNTPCSLGSQ